MADRIMVVTVGTSLFTSASWRPEGQFGLAGDYRSWCENLLESPAGRRSAGGGTEEALRLRLQQRWKDDVNYFVWPPDRPLRYSAEMATLLRWMEHEGQRDLGRFLTDRYERIELICPSDQEDPARVAADHLHAMLTTRLNLRHVERRDILTSRSLQDKVKHFQHYLDSLGTLPVDLIVAGGYKIFAMYASLAAASSEGRRQGRWQMIYVHEESYVELIVQRADEMEVEGRTFKPAPIIQ